MSYQDYFKNTPSYATRRSKLRRNQTKSEQVLWKELQSKKLGLKFRRQFQIQQYIVDFYCHTLKLIIELDGPIHQYQTEYDKQRQDFLVHDGYHVVRYLNDEVLFERESVMLHLLREIEKRKLELLRYPLPTSPTRGGVLYLLATYTLVHSPSTLLPLLFHFHP